MQWSKVGELLGVHDLSQRYVSIARNRLTRHLEASAFSTYTVKHATIAMSPKAHNHSDVCVCRWGRTKREMGTGKELELRTQAQAEAAGMR